MFFYFLFLKSSRRLDIRKSYHNHSSSYPAYSHPPVLVLLLEILYSAVFLMTYKAKRYLASLMLSYHLNRRSILGLSTIRSIFDYIWYHAYSHYISILVSRESSWTKYGDLRAGEILSADWALPPQLLVEKLDQLIRNADAFDIQQDYTSLEQGIPSNMLQSARDDEPFAQDPTHLICDPNGTLNEPTSQDIHPTTRDLREHNDPSMQELDEDQVNQSLEAARDNPEGLHEHKVKLVLESALGEIWKKIEANPNEYIMTRTELAVFNFFQYKTLPTAQARMARVARANYWTYGPRTRTP